MFRWLLLFLLLLPNVWAFAQMTLGLPEITNYTKQAYRGGAQTRKAAQDKTGILYFANDEGLLCFDGARWRIYPLPNRSLVRCIGFGPDNNLYVGGQDEAGYFSPGPDGTLRFHSLKERLPASARSFADVWGLCFAGSDVFFQTTDRIYRIGKEGAEVYPDKHWRFLQADGNEALAQSEERGLLRFRNGSWSPFGSGTEDLPPGAAVTSLTATGKESYLLTTLRHGLFTVGHGGTAKWQTPALAGLAAKEIVTACLVNDEEIAIGTGLDGCFIVDRGGNLVQHIGRREGLQDNSILTIFLDAQKNLWFGLHSGIDFIPYNNAVTHLGKGLMEGAGYSSALFQNNLYLGTSVGLFRIPVDNRESLSAIRSSAQPIKNSTGDAWNLSEVGGQLLLGHNDGAFLVKGDELLPLDRSTGYWNFQSLPGAPQAMVAGSYKGIEFYRQAKGSFAKDSTEAVVESARFVVTAYGKIWFSHPYKGIYAVTQTKEDVSAKKYGPKEGIVSVNNNYLFQIKKRLLLTTDDGVLAYNPARDLFEADTFYNRHLPRVPIRYLKEDAEGNVWFVFEKKMGVLDLLGEPRVVYFPELTSKAVAGFEHINPVDKANVLIGGEKGFYHINYARYKELRYPLQVAISGVAGINQRDSVLYGGYGATAYAGLTGEVRRQELGPAFNSLRFEFAAPMYGQLANVEYSYRLQGFDEGWSAFDRKTEKDYTALPPGDYAFQVKARNNLGNESEVREFRFTVLPPWYRTAWAYLLYALLIGFALYQFYRYQQRKFLAQQQKHEEEQRRLQYLHALEMDKAEKELVELRNAKLEVEIQAKNTELASAALHLVQKSDVLQKIKSQMSKLKEGAPATENAADLKKILKTLNEEHKIDEEWQQFSQHFDTVHRDFLSKLKTKHPALTPNEQKLCAYLKMNLTTKEIAQLMNITTRGVEISRYRLRKKLEVPSGMHLFNFLDGIG